VKKQHTVGRQKQPNIFSEVADSLDLTLEEVTAGLGDPLWRICNLYKIMDVDKQVITFRPNEAQMKLLTGAHLRVIILKARKMGFSTLIQIWMLDTALFSPNERCMVIAQDIGKAESIFRDTLKFAYDSLPEPLRQAMPTVGEPSKSQIRFKNNSIVEVDTSARSGTPSFLHISEYGKISAKDPGKAREIKTGSIEACGPNALIFIESTAEGRSGEYYDMVQTYKTLTESGKPLWNTDFKFIFFGWWEDSRYVAPEGTAIISPKDHEYFDNLELEIKRPITIEQRNWYMKKKDFYAGNEEALWSEMPSTPDEAFKVSQQGAYFTEQFRKARKEQRIGMVPYDPAFPVSTFWDLGYDDLTCIWFVQAKRTHYTIINYIEDSGESYDYYVRKVDQLNYVLGTAYVPHDAKQKRQGATENLTPVEMLMSVAPHWRFHVVDRVGVKMTAINQARLIFPLCTFDETNCKEGLSRLSAYKKQWNDRLGCWRDEPLHDINSNAADAFLQFAQAVAAGSFSPISGSQGGAFGNGYGAWNDTAVDMSF
jgi:hypothetical protein